MVPLTPASARAAAPSPASPPKLGTRQEHLRTLSIAWQLARLDLVRRYTATMLGVAWAVLSPLAMAGVIGLVFARLFGEDIRVFLPYLFLNLTLWSFFVACVDGGAIAFLAAEGYIKQIPRVSLFTYPLRMVLAAFFTLLLGLVAAALVAVGFGARIGLVWLWLAPGLAAWLLFGFGVACLSAVLNTAIRDFQYIQSVGIQALFYATPVMFPAKLLVQHGLGWMLTYNPLYHLMMLVRVPLLHADVAPVAHFVAAALMLGALLPLAAWIVLRVRPRVVFWL